MQIPLLSLGLFIFATGQTAIDEIQRKTSYRYGTGNAIGVLPTLQFLGQDNDTMTLPGVLYPEITDRPIVLDELRDIANTGQSYALLGGDGTYFGLWKITDIEETRKYLLPDGTPRKIEFSLNPRQQAHRRPSTPTADGRPRQLHDPLPKKRNRHSGHLPATSADPRTGLSRQWH